MRLRRSLVALANALIALRYRLEFRIRGRDYRMSSDRAAQLCASLFERELRARGARFSFDEATGTYRIEYANGLKGTISLSNVERELASTGDIDRVIRFAENMLAAVAYPDDWSKVKHHVFWAIESNEHVTQSDLAFHLSDQTHQVAVQFDPETKHILFFESHMLIAMSIGEEAVAEAADENLAMELRNADVIVREHESVRFGLIGSRLPFKAALILAPNLREIAEPLLGWPLFAVIPNRDFMYLYDAKCFENGAVDIFEKLPGLGAVVLEQYERGAYPLSTEVFEISDKGVRAVAEFSRHPPGEMGKEPRPEES